MRRYFRCSYTETDIRIEFIPSPHRFWGPDIIHRYRLPVQAVKDRRVVLTGPGAVWMYAHAAAVCRAAGAREICVDTPNKPGTSKNLKRCESLLILAGEDRSRGALLLIRLRPSPPLSPAAISRLLTPRLKELSQLRPQELVLAGRATVGVYAQAAKNAVDSGVRRITCWSARDGLVIVYDPDPEQLGRRITRPDWVWHAMPKPAWPVILGVIGDPNLGKSVFSNALDDYRERIGCDGWKLDCDGQSPTPAWYLSLAGDETSNSLREAQKRPWTKAMETSIVHQLQLSRELFPVLIADLPGGDLKVTPPQRIPPGRERILAEVDAFILLDREGAPSFAAWREALARHGLEDRIAAVLISSDPRGQPSLSVSKDGELWRGKVTGLERSRPTRELAEAFHRGLDRLWQPLLDFARRRTFPK